MAGGMKGHSETLKFKIYCIIEFSRIHGMTAPEAVDLFERYNVYSFLDVPELRWQNLEDTVTDIDRYIASRA
jgi:hypothetical protein